MRVTAETREPFGTVDAMMNAHDERRGMSASDE
jgi:hypothetical protein